ncbi:MAG: class I SAM-dependent methyltransferase [Butyrivibrio sp.]|nr:class I SAM-dependent methyltransferase [Butyrivibrio sp.]
MGLLKKVFVQTRKPEGVLGKMMISGMNKGHAKVADWGLSHLKTIAPSEILEVGCGGGRNARALMQKYPSAKMTAIDYSDTSLATARAYNADMIKNGRCEIKHGDVSALDLESDKYDLATAFETIYFWPGLEKCFSNVARVLKPGGTFMIVNESDGTDKAASYYENMIEGMKCHKKEDIIDALKSAGFSSVKADVHDSKPWITVVAKK